MLTLTCGDVVLRLAQESDDDTLVALMPDDFEHDPNFPREAGASLETHRERWLRQWLHGFRQPSMRDRLLAFVVSVDDVAVGLQTLEGEDVDRTHTYDSTSFLTPSARGRRLGVQMRQAIAALAFEQLGAHRMTSAARPDNVASQRVSERVGYRRVERREPLVAGLIRPIDCYELTRAQWQASERPPVQIDGVAPWIAAEQRRRELAERLLGLQVPEIWRNAAGGLTFDAGDGRFLKIGPSIDVDRVRSAERLMWASQWLTVPRVLNHGGEGDDVWLLTQGIPGRPAHEFAGRPRQSARELGRALREIHQRLPVDACPWQWELGPRLATLADDARRELGELPTLDAVVCHGDACAPNFLLDEAGRWCGTIDLGNLGVADRHADIVDALFSVRRNFGEDVDKDFLDGYGDNVDAERLDFYSTLWRLSR